MRIEERKEGFPMGKIIAGIIGFVGLMIVLTILFGSWYTVGQGERAILLQNGAIVGESQPGLNFKWPMIQSVETISVQQHSIKWQFGGAAAADTRMDAYSRDQQPAKMSVSVNYHIPESKVVEAYTVFQSEQKLVDSTIIRKAPQALKTVFGQFDAVTVIQDRGSFNAKVADAVMAIMKNDPVIIDSVQVEDITFSKAYEESVEARMLAEVEVQKRQQELAQKKVEATITVTNAQAQADSQLAVAKAAAESVRIQGQATADQNLAIAKAQAQATELQGIAAAKALKLKSDVLAMNPLLPEQTKAERWSGVLPTTIVPNASLPFFNALPQVKP